MKTKADNSRKYISLIRHHELHGIANGVVFMPGRLLDATDEKENSTIVRTNGMAERLEPR